MNNRFFLFLILNLFFTSVLLAQGDLVTFSVTGIAQIQDDNMPQARTEAMQVAFRNVVVMATENLVSQDRLGDVSGVIEAKIYKRSKNFIHHFKPLKSEVIGMEYHLPMEVTLSVKELKKALIENKILTFDYTAKTIRLINVKRFQEVEWVREVLEKEAEQLKHVVETYQKKGELHLKVETSSSLEEIMTQLNRAKSEAGAPDFKMALDLGVLEITF